MLNGENDCITTSNPEIKILSQKLKIDGITKYIEQNNFVFDNVFGDNETTQDVFKYSV